MKRLVLLLLVCITFSSCFFKKHKTFNKSKSFSKIFKSTDNEYRYKMAEEYYTEKKYSFALQLYEDLYAFLKGTDRYEEMYFKSANCFYFLNDYLNAENYYKSFVETFPGSKRSEDAEYLRAYCYFKQSPKLDLDQTSTTKSMALMQSFINGHPNSIRVKEATGILDLCREKLEVKEYKAAQLYYNLGYFKAAAIAFENVAENYPDSKIADEYKYQVILCYNKYAEMSFEEKQEERYSKVLSECSEFIERFADSKHISEIRKIKTQTLNILNTKKNEQVKKTN
ncbi:MAG: outer membrane protein assembly factor BamD [Bacteroidetes bacterium]|nr:outer membrane protein assembly factor BamD [Bacteroidota bacterium]